MRVEKVNMFFFSFGVFTHFSRERESHLKPSFNHLRHECKSWSNQLYLNEDIRLLSVLLLLHYSAWIAWGCPIREVLSSLAIQIQLFLSGLVKINTHSIIVVLWRVCCSRPLPLNKLSSDLLLRCIYTWQVYESQPSHPEHYRPAPSHRERDTQLNLMILIINESAQHCKSKQQQKCIICEKNEIN